METQIFTLSDKIKIHGLFLKLQQDKIDLINKRIAELQNSISNETKSSAGDKHETSLAHLQIDIAQQQNQLEQLLIQWRILNQITEVNEHQKIQLGSLVNSNHEWFYLSASLGKVDYNGIKIQAVSQQAPLGMVLLNKKISDPVIFNGKPHIIYSIL